MLIEMLELQLLGLGYVVAFSGVLIPGPLLAYIIIKSLSSGAKTGPLSVVGHILVELGLAGLIILGVSFVLVFSAIKLWMGLLGGGVLALLGVLNLLKARRIGDFKPEAAGLNYHPIVGGILFSTILNPSVLVWWSIVGFTMLAEATLVAALVGAVFWLLGHFLADLTWYSLVSVLSSKGRGVMGLRGHRVALAGTGLFFAAFGVFIALNSLGVIPMGA